MKQLIDSAAMRRKNRLAIKRDARNRFDGLALLRSTYDGEAAAVFFDPQYRAILDKMSYGNEGKSRERARVALPQMGHEKIHEFIGEIARILKPSGHLFFWFDKFAIGSGLHTRYLRPWTSGGARPALAIVDLIHWNKMRPGMGRRARCRSEYLVIIQKQPTRAKGIWIDHRIDDSWPEQSDRSIHPHAKPHQLTERLIRATTKRGDVVVDPCAGSYVVLDACIATGRIFVGCDLKK